MKQESLKINGWIAHPHFDQHTGKLEEIELSFNAGSVQLCEIRVPNEPGRIEISNKDGIGLCLKPARKEEKYGSWLQIKSTEKDVFCSFKEWLSR